jgi:hypothetical protein
LGQGGQNDQDGDLVCVNKNAAGEQFEQDEQGIKSVQGYKIIFMYKRQMFDQVEDTVLYNTMYSVLFFLTLLTFIKECHRNTIRLLYFQKSVLRHYSMAF